MRSCAFGAVRYLIGILCTVAVYDERFPVAPHFGTTAAERFYTFVPGTVYRCRSVRAYEMFYSAHVYGGERFGKFQSAVEYGRYNDSVAAAVTPFADVRTEGLRNCSV